MRPLHARFALWSALLLACSLYQWQCGSRWPSTSCASAATRDSLAPRWLGTASAVAGPAPLWLALALHGGARRAWLGGPVLVLAVGLFLGLAFPMRYLAHVLPTGWDPSGHVFVFGLQLVPLWAELGRRASCCFPAAAVAVAVSATPESAAAKGPGGDTSGAIGGGVASDAVAIVGLPAPADDSAGVAAAASAAAAGLGVAVVAAEETNGDSSSPALLAALCLEPLLLYLSFTTALFFHDGSEVFAAWLVMLSLLLAAGVLAARNTSSGTADAASLARRLQWPVGAAWATGLVFAVAAIALSGQGAGQAGERKDSASWVVLAIQVAYDTVVGACVLRAAAAELPRTRVRLSDGGETGTAEAGEAGLGRATAKGDSALGEARELLDEEGARRRSR